MVRLCSFVHFFLLCSVAVLLMTGLRIVQAASQTRSFAGVFMFIEDGKYTLNFTAATAACLDLNVTMATTAQMERALQHGLETCKFGWTAQQIAVIPRNTSDIKCGMGKTGVVTWYASPQRMFAVFCFNISALTDSKDVLKTTPVGPPSLLPSTPATSTLITATSFSNRKSTTTKSTKQKLPTSTFTQPQHTTGIPVTATPSYANIPPSLSHAAVATDEAATFVSSTSVYSFVSTEPVPPVEHSLGVSRTTFIILGVSASLLTAAGAIWHYKRMFFPCWSREQLKDDIETEMWKNTYSENDLRSQAGTEEEEDGEEVYRKYSSDITLCVNPSIKGNCSKQQ